MSSASGKDFPTMLRKEQPEALTRADRERISDCLRACAEPLPYNDTEKVALLDLAGRIERED